MSFVDRRRHELRDDSPPTAAPKCWSTEFDRRSSRAWVKPAVGDFTLPLKPGHHVIEVRYQKPAETAPLLRLEQTPGKSIAFMNDAITPFETQPSALSRRGVAASLSAGCCTSPRSSRLHGALAGHSRAMIARAFRSRLLSSALLLAQGVWKSQHLVDRVWTMSGGDDWLNYEMSGRDVVLNGLIMSQGGVIGRGQPFSLYPGYAYFVAFAHWLTGESIAGVVLVELRPAGAWRRSSRIASLITCLGPSARLADLSGCC